MNRFKETEIGKYLNDRFPKVLDIITNSTELGCLPDPKFIREVWDNTPGIKFEDRLKFEELIMFYNIPCETKTMIENEIANVRNEPLKNFKEYRKNVLYLLALIGGCLIAIGISKIAEVISF